MKSILHVLCEICLAITLMLSMYGLAAWYPTLFVRPANEHLLYAADTRSISGVVSALAAGASPMTRDESGATPLMHAAMVGDAEIVSYLLDLGVEINAIDCFGQNALIYAARCNHEQVVQILLERGSDTGPDTNQQLQEIALANSAAPGQ